jgi:hypothetical protein
MWAIYLVSICFLVIDVYDNDVFLDQQNLQFFCSTFGVTELIDVSE